MILHLRMACSPSCLRCLHSDILYLLFFHLFTHQAKIGQLIPTLTLRAQRLAANPKHMAALQVNAASALSNIRDDAFSSRIFSFRHSAKRTCCHFQFSPKVPILKRVFMRLCVGSHLHCLLARCQSAAEARAIVKAAGGGKRPKQKKKP